MGAASSDRCSYTHKSVFAMTAKLGEYGGWFITISRSAYKFSSQVKIKSKWPGMPTKWVLLHLENALHLASHKSVVALDAMLNCGF